MSVGLVGQPAREDRTQRSDRVVRLSATSSEWRKPLSSELDAAVQRLRAVLVTELHGILLDAQPPHAPPLWPREELQFACYSRGGHYAPHVDAESDAGTRTAPGTVGRLFTAIYYPNSGEEVWGKQSGGGGALRLWPEGSYESVEVSAVGDRLIVFSSTLGHEVLPVVTSTAGVQRCAFTSWFSAVRA